MRVPWPVLTFLVIATAVVCVFISSVVFSAAGGSQTVKASEPVEGVAQKDTIIDDKYTSLYRLTMVNGDVCYYSVSAVYGGTSTSMDCNFDERKTK